jgi:hypothetical protein
METYRSSKGGKSVDLSNFIDKTTAQDVIGLKTFLYDKFGLRNFANTFTSYFRNFNTASRKYTLQDKDGTLADLQDVATKMDKPIDGEVDFIPKFSSEYEQVNSRLKDTGNAFGIGTSYSPTHAITLGNDSDKFIAVEESDAYTKGRDFNSAAGRANDYRVNSVFNSLATGFSFVSIAMNSSGDLYCLTGGGVLYKRVSGDSDFNIITISHTTFREIGFTFDDRLYGVDGTGATYGLYIQNTVDDDFTRYLRGPYGTRSGTIASNGDIYTCGNHLGNGQILKIPFGDTVYQEVPNTVGKAWINMTSSIDGDIYAVVRNGNIYKQTKGIGEFIPISAVRDWYDIECLSNGNIFASTTKGDIFIQYQGVGEFTESSQIISNWGALTSDTNNNVYCINGGSNLQVTSGDLYFLSSSNKGTINLDGGTRRNIAGTGKGLGESNIEDWTGQQKENGTDMQVSTLRRKVNNLGHTILYSTPTYEDNAAALLGGLEIGTEYKTSTGVKMEVF